MLVTVPAVAVKLAVVPPAATITEAGTVSAALFDERTTDAPPARAADVNITVQLAVPPEVTEFGEQDRLETAGSIVTVTEVVTEPFRVAVSVTV